MFLSANPTLVAIVAGIVVIGVLIFVHELGHFLAAKAVGIAVLRFSFGLGPRTPLGIKIGETDYCISWIPFGGFVKMAGLEDEALEGGRQEHDVPPERTFDAKPLWARIVVILAGVAMNALFAFGVYTVVARAYGVPYDPSVTVNAVDAARLPLGAAALRTLQPGDRIVRIDGDSMTTWGDVQDALLSAHGARITIEVAGRSAPLLVDVSPSDGAARDSLVGAIQARHAAVLGAVTRGQPAAAAGLQTGDTIVSIGGTPVPSWEAMVGTIEKSAGRPLELAVRRSAETLRRTVTPQATKVQDPATGATRTVGRIGVGIDLPVRRLGWAASLGDGAAQTGRAAGLILWTLKGLVTGQVSPRELGGPILVGQISGQVVRLGLEAFLMFLALFSINLAILNLLPIPVLDGGHIVFLVIEGVRGRPLSLEQRQRLTQIGFFVLVGIMALALANDFLRLFH